MVYRTRINYTAAQRAEMWDRWQRGESLREIGRAFDRPSSSVFNVLSPSGGIRPHPRLRPRQALMLIEREEVSRGIAAGLSMRAMARQLGRAPSTISREISRNGGLGCYRASRADQAAWDRALRPKPCKLATHTAVRRAVVAKLRLHWSPEQIAGWLRRQYPQEIDRRVSHETIYRSLFIQARGALKKELQAHLRSRRAIRRSRHSTKKREGQGQITNTVSIRERPAEAQDRAVPGHWEGDLIEGAKGTFIATLVERHTRYLMLAKVNGRDTETVINALIKQAHKLPRELYKSLTWGQGKEMADHQRFTLATDIQVYVCDPHSPWQRGSNENTNGLLRQYFPKGTDLSVHSQAKFNAVARPLNERPRKLWVIIHLQKNLVNVLQRPVEIALHSGHLILKRNIPTMEQYGVVLLN